MSLQPIAAKAVLLLGGTGKVASLIAPLLSSNEIALIYVSDQEKKLTPPHCHGVKFDWFDPSTYNSPSTSGFKISAIFIVAPPVVDQLPLTIAFIELALSQYVKRFVLLGGSVLPVEDGPLMDAISRCLSSLNVEYAILSPSWFMENFSDAENYRTIIQKDRMVTTAGDGNFPLFRPMI